MTESVTTLLVLPPLPASAVPFTEISFSIIATASDNLGTINQVKVESTDNPYVIA